MTQDFIDYHIIIVGGGIVGLTLASLLSSSSLRIAVIENNDFSSVFDASIHYPRVSAINRASETIFKHIGIWQTIKHMRVSTYKKMRVSDNTLQQTLFFDCSEVGETNLGHIIENQVISVALVDYLKHQSTISLFPHFEISDLEFFPDYGVLHDAHGRKLKCQLIVAADGKESWLRKKINIPMTQKDYQHTAIVTHVETEKPHCFTAYQHFLPLGPLAFLPLSHPQHCSIVWSTTPNHAQELYALPKEEFDSTLTKAFQNQLGNVVSLSPLHLFPLHYQHVKNYFQGRVVTIGDAAHTIHPMAGLGLNLGLLDAACLAEHILKSKDISHLELEKILRRFELQQKNYNFIVLQTINFLKTLFCSSSFPTTIFKVAGLTLVKHTPPLKHFLTQFALGIKGNLPVFAKTNSVEESV